MAFEFTPPTEGINKTNSLIFVGGLTDGFCTVPYVAKLAKALENTEWSVFSVLLSSSYAGWGVGSLDRDVEEIGQCVRFIRDLKASRQPGALTKAGKIAIMGHSTGSQDVLHYLHSPNPLPSTPGQKRPRIDGAILQSPVSDRQALLNTIKAGSATDSSESLEKLFAELVATAKANPGSDGADFLLPPSMIKRIGLSDDAPVSSRRFLSLTSPDSPASPQEDDLFSSDLTDERLKQTFGMIGTRGLLGKSLLVAPGGADEFVPDWVDKEKLLKRWETATKQGAGDNARIWDGNTGLIPGAKHSPSGESQAEPRRELASRIARFLKNLEQH